MSSVNDEAVCMRCGKEFEYSFDCKTGMTDRISMCDCDKKELKLKETIKKLRSELRKKNKIKKECYYLSKGIALMNLWGGGKCYYPTIKYMNKSLKMMKEKIKRDTESMAIDSGMGCESIDGVVMKIRKITNVWVNNKIFSNEEGIDIFTFGKINEKEIKEAAEML